MKSKTEILLEERTEEVDILKTHETDAEVSKKGRASC